MSLEFYYDESFSLASNLDPVDTFTGDGTATFTVTKKSGSELAATITAGNVQYYQFNGGFTKSGDDFTLSTSPSIGSQIVAPGLIALTFSAFDQSVVSGVTNPQVSEIPFYLGDPDTIHLKTYTNLPQYTGIRITVQDLVSGSGAELSWIQLACSDAASGLATTYAATGEELLTSALYATGTLSASSAAGASSITVSGASGEGFWAGDYVIINIGESTSEIRKISSVSGDTINFFTAFDYSHLEDETAYTMGRKFWAKVTIPENAANNQAFTFWDLGLRRQARNNSKV